MSIKSWRRVAPLLFLVTSLAAGGCASDARPSDPVLKVGAIPDQDPEQLQRLYNRLVEHLTSELAVPVEYVPVTDYAAAVTLFRTGDLDLVWFGGLTGVQARIQTPGAQAIVQRDIDAEFRSVFIANAETDIEPFTELAGLAALRDHRITFGSESSTSGRLMPQYFLLQAGVKEGDFDGPPGFSGSHDATIDLVEAGTYEIGALNEQVWTARVASADVDTTRVVEVFRTPPYTDYHWLLRPDVDDRFGEGFGAEVQAVLLGLDEANADDAKILELFGAHRFVATSNDNYAAIEEVADELGLLTR